MYDVRLEFIGHGSNKFWEIEQPRAQDNQFVVWVRFGKIGTEGQYHPNVFWSLRAATEHYQKKIREKLRKGYTDVRGSRNAVQETSPARAVCEHLELTKSGENIWKCADCRTTIEFEKKPGTVAIEPARVRRFIDLRRRP